ncbi:MAG: recombinase family protein [Oscillospiraceae bacterium]|nr:recombinase family protein [Oscillospiraceae bacterium]
MNLESQYKRAGIYIAPSAYGVPVDRKEALESCKTYASEHECLKLMRIYVDEIASVIRIPEKNGRRMPLGVTGNDAWQRLLKDTETSAIETVVVYAARTVAPSISRLAYLIREYFLPCGIGFIDVEAGFDSETGDVDEYLRHKTREYRSTLYGKKVAE